VLANERFSRNAKGQTVLNLKSHFRDDRSGALNAVIT